jgi:hypothetical protein
MKTSILHLCLVAAALAFHPSAHADTMIHPLPICPPVCPELPKPYHPLPPPPPPFNPWSQLAVTGTDDGCVKLPGKPTRPFPISTTPRPV